MAKKASAKGSDESKKKKAGTARSASKGSSSGRQRSTARQTSSKRGAEGEQMSAGDALVKLLESPLVIDLLAVGASAALAALAEHRFSRRQGATANVNTRRAMKAAGTAAAAAIGRRLSEEWQEIRDASERARAGEAA